MANWTAANGTTSIVITRDSQSFSISKFARITMSVTEPVLYFSYSDNNPTLVNLRSDNKKKNQVNIRKFEIDFNDVTSPVIISAADLQAIINSWLQISSIASGSVYSDVTGLISFASDRIPSDIQAVMVIGTMQISVVDGKDETIGAKIDGASIGNISNAYTTTVGGLNITNFMMTFIVPAGSAYQFFDSGGGTPSIISVFELLL